MCSKMQCEFFMLYENEIIKSYVITQNHKKKRFDKPFLLNKLKNVFMACLALFQLSCANIA